MRTVSYQFVIRGLYCWNKKDKREVSERLLNWKAVLIEIKIQETFILQFLCSPGKTSIFYCPSTHANTSKRLSISLVTLLKVAALTFRDSPRARASIRGWSNIPVKTSPCVAVLFRDSKLVEACPVRAVRLSRSFARDDRPVVAAISSRQTVAWTHSQTYLRAISRSRWSFRRI